MNGTVVPETELPEGARVAIVVGEDEPAFDLDAADEEAIAAAIAQLEAGQGRPVAELDALLARHR